MTDAHFGWGIVGPGEIAGVFATSLEGSGAGALACVYGRDPERRRAFAARFGGRAVGDLESLVAAPDVQAVYVATPHPAHASAVRAALEAGRAVLCEKPLTTGPAETRSLVELARKTGSPLVEAWMYRTHPQIAHAFDLVARGEIGRLRRIDSWFGFAAPFDPTHRLFDPALGGGAILDVGGYPISLALGVCAAASGRRVGPAPRIVSAHLERQPSGVEGHAEVRLAFSGGCEARLSTSIDRETGRGAVVSGEAGSITFADPFLPGGTRDGVRAEIVVRRGEETTREELASPQDCYAAEALALRRLVESGGAEVSWPLVGHEESVAIAQVAAAWREAGQTRGEGPSC